MVPDKFNMVDMDGIDLIMMQGEEVSGLYTRLVESIAQCRYQCLYNWFFDGVVIPPTYVKMEVNEDDEVVINEGVTVSSDDVIHIYSIEPTPEIIPLLVEENGTYNAPTGTDGFNPVTVDVPGHVPVIESITITENGTYNVSVGVDGFNPVTVNVPSTTMLTLNREPTIQDGDVGDYCISETLIEYDSVGVELVRVARGTDYNFTYYGTSAFRLVLEDGAGNTINVTDLSNAKFYIKSLSPTGSSTDATGALTASPSGSYYEKNGLPGYFIVQADNIGNYTPVSVGWSRRNSNDYRDFVSSFRIVLLSYNNIVATIKSVSNLTLDDWPNNQIVSFTDFINTKSRKLYYKTELGWVQII